MSTSDSHMGIMTTAHENLGNADPIRSAVPISKRLSILNISSTVLVINPVDIILAMDM